MGTRLATHSDIPRLQEMLAAMGQNWSQGAIREKIDDPRAIVMLREIAHLKGPAVVDGFCFNQSLSAEDALFGPMDVATSDVRDWLLGIIEMAFSMAWVPSVVGNVNDQVLHFKIWPSHPNLREYVRGQFNVKKQRKARKWKRGDGDAYEVESDGCWHFHIRRAELIRLAQQIRAA